jgi:predicted RNA-binding Zn-ribbon protein involved in translation (DUF1610 family)
MYREIRSFDNYLYANIVLNRLKDEGFTCYLKDENTVTIDPLLSPAIGGMKLMVLEHEVGRAISLLDQVEAEYLATVPCPTCGQQALQQLKKTSQPKNIISAIFTQLVTGSSSQETRMYRCSNCGHTMSELPGEHSTD